MILLPNSDLKMSIQIAESLRKKVEKFKFTGVERVTSSFGVGKIDKNESKEKFLKRIDEALYKSKENGRNRITISEIKNQSMA